jgi:formylglycine-generating enzyme required for sulfatase activity
MSKFLQVGAVAAVLLAALGFLSVAAAQESKGPDGSGHLLPNPFQAPQPSKEAGGSGHLTPNPFQAPQQSKSKEASAGTASPPKDLTLDLGGGVKLELVLIPAGEFLMGSPNSDKDAEDNEKPQHRVRITKPFYLGKYPVTLEQWIAVMGNDLNHFKFLKFPVEHVNWDDCQAFLRQLNVKFGAGRGTFQLPTEAQWEYACRAGSTTRFSFGDDAAKLGDYAWYSVNCVTTQAVGTRKPNAWGLYDMHGNVCQWCADWYDKAYYAGSPSDDPPGPAKGLSRVARGGSWHNWGSWHPKEKECRSAYRSYNLPGFRFNYVGFRVCLSLETAPPPKPPVVQTKKAPPKELAVDLGGDVKLEMVLIPAGEFRMGSSDADKMALANEKPEHRVRVTRPFYLAKYPVTQEQWQAVMGGNPSYVKAPKNPVERVSWDHCQIFLRRLNAKAVGQGGTFTLPSDAQWEYACRAGSGTKYCFGDDEKQLGDYAWYKANAGGKTHPVGEKKPNAWGLCDMHGNVWEWCQDWYAAGYYAISPMRNPVGPNEGPNRVVRGGAWSSDARYCRSPGRFELPPGTRNVDVGFRVALGIEGAEEAPEMAASTKLLAWHPGLDLGGGVMLELFLIPAGEFSMGTGFMDKDVQDEEKPEHRVRITRPFYLGRYPVTQAQWQVVMGNNPSHFKGPTNPVENVSWDDCQAFLGKLNAKLGPSMGTFRLPTEAQWEYACRAGSTTRYYFGDSEYDLTYFAWYRRDSSNRWDHDPDSTTKPVGQKRPNDWWLYDMCGNVSQWCQDYYGQRYYGTLSSDDATEDPVGPATSGHRVTRGGSYASSYKDCRSASRGLMSPEDRSDAVGFRVCLLPPE